MDHFLVFGFRLLVFIARFGGRFGGSFAGVSGKN